ncbi:MAG: hypothetical protein HY722_06185 [Planctomycetes bacterium]|nr:hypothetical protein [Planctomycetota bacterium]
MPTIEFASGSGLDAGARLSLCADLIQTAAETPPSPVRYARWLRDHGVSDRETGVFLASLLGIRGRSSLEAGTVAGELRKALEKGGQEGDAFRTALFERMLALDGYLALHVLGAFKTSNGLLSDRELYARISSPSYGGRRPTSAGLGHWLTWMLTLGAIEKVGFQRRLTPMAEAGLAYLEGASEEELRPPPEEEEEPPAPVAGATPQAPVAEAAPTAAPEPAPAPAPEPVTASVPPLLEAPPEVDESLAPSAYAPHHRFFSEAIPRDAACEASARRVLAWWHAAGCPAADRASALGIELAAGPHGGVDGTRLFALFAAARCLEAGPGGRALWAALAGVGTLERLYREETSLEEVLEGPVGEAPAAGLLVDLVRYRRRLQGEAGRALARARTSEQLLEALTAVAGTTAGAHLFWIPREMRLAGLWRFPEVERLCPVPTAAVREHAYRLGLLPGHYARGTEELALAARRLSVWFRASEGFDLPLAHFARTYGCAFHCERSALCHLDCREREGPGPVDL